MAAVHTRRSPSSPVGVPAESLERGKDHLTPGAEIGALTASRLFDRLLELSSEAERAGNYETAYHVLMGALHVADRAGDLAQVRQVSDRASEQELRLEAIEPPHVMARASAQLRGTQPLYRSIQVHADAVRARLQNRPRGLAR